MFKLWADFYPPQNFTYWNSNPLYLRMSVFADKIFKEVIELK